MNCMKKEIKCPADIMGRNAHRFVQKISTVKSDVYVMNNTDSPINAKSLLGVLSAQIKIGNKITISCNNEDENLANMELNYVVSVLNRLGVEDENM